MESITKIKEQLPQGAQTEIAKKCNVSVQKVNNVLNGRGAADLNVLNAIVDYYTEYKEKKDKLFKRIEALA